jgi:hypothetical protein
VLREITLLSEVHNDWGVADLEKETFGEFSCVPNMNPKMAIPCEPVSAERADEMPVVKGAKYENAPANLVNLPPIKAVTLRFDPVPSFAKQVILESETTIVSRHEVFPTNIFASTFRCEPKLNPDSINLPPTVGRHLGLRSMTTATS